MMQWIGDNDTVFYSWSMTDYHQIRNEICLKCEDEARWGRVLDQANWIDYQEIFGKRIKSTRPMKLSEALALAEVDTEGREHDGLADAYNTACMISKLEIHKDYQTLIERNRAHEANQKPLTASLGCLLQGLALELA